MGDADKDGWVEHTTGECPLPEGLLVKARYSNGYEERSAYPARAHVWCRDPSSPYHLTHYKVVK